MAAAEAGAATAGMTDPAMEAKASDGGDVSGGIAETEGAKIDASKTEEDEGTGAAAGRCKAAPHVAEQIGSREGRPIGLVAGGWGM
eukprot:g27727.t1